MRKKVLRFGRVVVHRQDGGKYHRNMIGPRQFRQGSIVGLDVFQAHGAGVAGNVIGAGQNDHHLGMQVNYILAEAHQHLRRGLPADAAVEVRLAGERVFELPDIGDGISEEDDAVLSGRGRLEGGVGVAVAGQLAVVVGEDRNARGPVLVEAGEAGGGNGGLLGRGAERKQHDGRKERKWRDLRCMVSSGRQDSASSMLIRLIRGKEVRR